VVINAMNLIDGVDGLAGSLTIISALFFAGWFFMAGYYGEAVFSLILAGAFLGFLFHNWQPASIFMGDTGALLSGFYLSVLGIRFLNTAVNGPAVAEWQIAAPVILVTTLCPFMIPCECLLCVRLTASLPLMPMQNISITILLTWGFLTKM